MKKQVKIFVVAALILLSVAAGSSYGSANGKILEYAFDSGCPVQDVSNSGTIYDGTCSSVATGVQGIKNTTGDWDYDDDGGYEGVGFDGSSSYIDIGDLGFNNGDSITVSVWANKDSTTAGKSVAGEVNRGRATIYYEEFQNNGYEFRVYDGSSSHVVTSGVTSANEWAHIVGVVDSAGNMEIYVNGSLKDSTTGVEPAYANSFGLGGDTASNGKYFDGTLDEHKIFDRGLDSTEVTNLYSYNSITSPSASLSNPNPADGEQLSGTTANISIDYSDPEGDSADVTLKWGNGTVIKTEQSVSSGSTVYEYFTGLNSSTTYEWSANSTGTDGETVSTQTFNFTTGTPTYVDLTVDKPTGNKDFVDQRIVLDSQVNDTADIKYNFDGGSNTTACSSCSNFTSNITDFKELSEGSHTLNVYAVAENVDKTSIDFTYSKNEFLIPETPYSADFSLLMNWHDMSTGNTEIDDIEYAVDELNNYTGVPSTDKKSWDSIRYTFALMPLYTYSSTNYWINRTTQNQPELVNLIESEGSFCGSGPLEFSYHTQASEDKTAQPTGSQASNTSEFNHMNDVISAWTNTLSCRPQSSIGGWRNLDRYTERNLDRIGINVEYTGNTENTGLRKPVFNNTYFESKIDTTDYTNVDADSIPQAEGTFNFYKRQISDEDITTVKLPDNMGNSNQLADSSLTELKNQINYTYNNNGNIVSMNAHVATPANSGTSFNFTVNDTVELSKWFYDYYVNSSRTDARFTTPSEQGYQRLGRQTATVETLSDNSSSVVYNVSSAEDVEWVSFGLNKSFLNGRDNSFEVDYGSGNQNLEVARETDNRYWFNIHLSSAEVTASSDSTDPSLSIDSPLNQTYTVDSLNLNVTSDEAVNFTRNVEYRNGSTVLSNKTYNESDTDLNVSLDNLPDAELTVNVWGEDSSGNVGSATTDFTVAKAYVQINESVQINQTANNAYFNITSPFRVDNLTVYDDATNFGGINWTVTSDVSQAININLDYFNDDNADNTYLANYSVSTAVGASVTNTFVPRPVDSVYQITRNSSFLKQVQSDSNSVMDYGYEVMSDAYTDFTVKRTDQFRPEFNSSTYQLDQQNNIERLNFVLWTRGENDVASSSPTTNRVELTNTSLKYDVSLPLTESYRVTDFPGLSRTRNIDLAKSDSGVIADSGYSHTLSSQRQIQELNITNNEVEPVDYNWTSQFGTEFTGTIGQSSTISREDFRTQDFLNNSTDSFNVGTDEVVLGFNYTGSIPLNIDNSASTAFDGVSTDGGYEIVNQCTVINNTEVDVPTGSSTFQIGQNCNPGNIGNPTQDIVNISDSEERIWYNSTDMQVYTNKTSSTNIVIRADKSNLKNPDNRDGGSLSAIVEGVDSINNTDLNVTDTGSFFRVTVGDIQASTLYTDDNDWSVTYTLSGDNTEVIGGGGGGGTPTSDDQVISFGSTTSEEGIETFNAPFGQTVTRELTVRNSRQDSVTAEIVRGSEDVCQYVTVQDTLDADTFGSTGSYDMPPAELSSLGNVRRSTEQVQVRFSLPSEEELNEQGITDYRCSFDTSSSYGTAENLVLEIDEGFNLGFLEVLADEFCLDSPYANLVDGGDGVESNPVSVCFALWQWLIGVAALIAAIVFGVRRL